MQYSHRCEVLACQCSFGLEPVVKKVVVVPQSSSGESVWDSSSFSDASS